MLTTTGLATSGPEGASSTETVQARLRRVTWPLHLRVEKIFDLQRQVASIEGYRTALSRLRAIHASAASALDKLDLAVAAASRDRTSRRVGWLDQDLADVGAASARATACALDLVTSGEGVGCLYVLEGSMLGGQHIFRRVSAALGLSAVFGARYFNGFGDGTDSIWTSFVTALNTMPPNSLPDLESGARKTFALFEA